MTARVSQETFHKQRHRKGRRNLEEHRSGQDHEKTLRELLGHAWSFTRTALSFYTQSKLNCVTIDAFEDTNWCFLGICKALPILILPSSTSSSSLYRLWKVEVGRSSLRWSLSRLEEMQHRWLFLTNWERDGLLSDKGSFTVGASVTGGAILERKICWEFHVDLK